MSLDPETNRFGRLLRTSAEMEAQELHWWAANAEIEYRFCWVQPESIQRILRGRYIDLITRIVGSAPSVLELGCGTGWLARLMVKSGVSNVTAIDFSPEQIQIALKETPASLKDRIDFSCKRGEELCRERRQFEYVLMHGFLHHLSVEELEQTLVVAALLTKPGGKILLFEPIRTNPVSRPGFLFRAAMMAQKALARVARPDFRFRLIRETSEERELRARIAQRMVGRQGRGPAPKELPLSYEELEQALPNGITITQTEVCMLRSHLTVQEWLLQSCSSRRKGLLLVEMVAWLAARLDRICTREKNIPTGFWAFSLIILSRDARQG